MTLRGLDWAVVIGGSSFGAAILTVCVAFGADGPRLIYVRIALITLVAAAAFVLDEPAAATVDATPTTRRRRTGARVTAVAAPLAVWACAVLALEQRNSATPVGAMLVEGAGPLAVAVASSAALRRVGYGEPGEIVASVLGAGILGVLIFDPPLHAPLFPETGGWAASSALWAGLTVSSAALVIKASGEPFQLPGRRSGPVRRGC